MRGLTEMDKKKISEKAEELLKKFEGFIDGSLVKIFEIAQAEGFTMVNAEFADDGLLGSVVINPGKDILKTGNERVIVVNYKKSLEDKRFILAHELSHYFLEYSGQGQFISHKPNRKNKGQKEQDVDFLAACLLMPEERFRQRYEELKNEGRTNAEISISLQEEFKVPLEAALRRIDEVA